MRNYSDWEIGVIGAGAMGSGIAQIAATNGHKVFVYDNNQNSIEVSKLKMQKILSRLVEKERLTREKADSIYNRIEYTEALEKFDSCQLVIEAIIENIEIKKKVFSKLESIVEPDCILASNTSSLSISSIAAACELSNRVIGIHFFNPAPIMKLTEIIPAIQTAEMTINQSKLIIDSWNKTTVIAKDTPGFIVNRIARPFYSEAIRIYEEGIADFATIDHAMTSIGGFRMGPFALMDYIGNDVNYAVTESVWKSFYYEDRYKPSFTQKRQVEAGFLGRKTGIGFFNYQLEEKATSSEDKALLNSIFDRIIIMLINEAYDALFWNIASSEDIDNAMTKGVNYPKGLLAWGKEIGIQDCISRMNNLYDLYKEDRYRCSVGLKRMV